MKDIFDQNKDIDFIKQKLYHKVLQNKQIKEYELPAVVEEEDEK